MGKVFKHVWRYVTNMKFNEWILLKENNSRYSVEVNYRTGMSDVLRGFAKISLGYVSAAMKKSGYHIKIVFEKDLGKC